MRRGKILIAGFDIATSCGGADGCPSDNRPRAWTWDLAAAGKERPAKFAMLMKYCERYFSENQVDAVFYEMGLPIGALMAAVARNGAQAGFKMGASDATIGFLRGAIGIVEACAAKHGVLRIEGVRVQSARLQLLGFSPKRGEGKEEVSERCRVLGWGHKNLDESDALAIWSMGVGLMSPLNSYKSLPIFSTAGKDLL